MIALAGQSSPHLPAYATGWFRFHGVGFLDVVLPALTSKGALAALDRDTTAITPHEQFTQLRAAGYYDEPATQLTGCLSSVVYLHAPGAELVRGSSIRDLVSDAKWKSVIEAVRDSWVPRTWPDWRDGFSELKDELEGKLAFPGLAWFRRPSWDGGADLPMRALWHVILDAPVDTQVAWYKKYSPLYRANAELIRFEKLNVDDVEDVRSVTLEMKNWLDKEPERRWIINTWGAATGVQFGWHFLAWQVPAVKHATFLRCRTAPATPEERRRFRPLIIQRTNADPIGALVKEVPREKHESEAREHARRRIEDAIALGDNFSLLVMGERGVGKTRTVWGAAKSQRKEKPFEAVNCAAFSDPTHARSELFGHAAGAFTGAGKKRSGRLEKAADGVLFLDEVHLLDKATMGLLLTALETDEQGFFRFHPLGSEDEVKVKFQPVFGTNMEWSQLVERLPPDFLDRVSQRVVTIPALTREDAMKAWPTVWGQMKFTGFAAISAPSDPEFDTWLGRQQFPGNFRDLERIAILVADWQRSRDRPTGSLVKWLEQEYSQRNKVEPKQRHGDVLADTLDVTALKPDDFVSRAKMAYATRWLSASNGVKTQAANAIARKFNIKFAPNRFLDWLRGRPR